MIWMPSCFWIIRNLNAIWNLNTFKQLNSGHVQLSSPPPLTPLFLGAIVKTCFGYIKTQLHLLKCYCCLVFGPQHITMSENSTFVWYLDAIPILEHLTSRQL